jgi:hypothetical protein
MSDKFPWKIYFLYCILVALGFALIQTIGNLGGPAHRGFENEFGISLIMTLYPIGFVLVALVALPLTMIHDYMRNRKIKKNQEPPAEPVHIQTNYERPPEPKPETRKRPWIWWAFALHLAACYFIPFVIASNDFLFRHPQRQGDDYMYLLAAIGGFILAPAGRSWILKGVLFIVGIVVSLPLVFLSSVTNYCAYQQLCL